MLLEAMTLAETQEDRALLEQILLETSLPPHNDSAGGLPLPCQCVCEIFAKGVAACRRRRLHFQRVRTC